MLMPLIRPESNSTSSSGSGQGNYFAFERFDFNLIDDSQKLVSRITSQSSRTLPSESLLQQVHHGAQESTFLLSIPGILIHCIWKTTPRTDFSGRTMLLPCLSIIHQRVTRKAILPKCKGAKGSTVVNHREHTDSKPVLITDLSVTVA